MNVTREDLRTLVRGTYDIQDMRIQLNNRLIANQKTKMGVAPDEAQDGLDVDAEMIMHELRLNYEKLTSKSLTFPRQRFFKGNDVITSYTELSSIESFIKLEEQERVAFLRLKSALKEFPIYTEWLEKIRGVGPAMAGVILSEFDIHRAQYPSSLHRYAGLDVARDGRGRSKQKDHLIDVEYKAADGTIKTKKSITYNPWLKTKLLGVLATSFIRMGNNPYRDIYDDYKHRLEHHPKHKDKTKGHRNNMAIRYMIKRFLIDLYNEWRAIEGLPVAPTYEQAKLNMVHKSANKYKAA